VATRLTQVAVPCRFAAAGASILLGLWVYSFTRLWFRKPAWVWPFSSLQGYPDPTLLALAWIVPLVAGLMLFTWVAWKVVLWLKERYIAPYTGSARHAFRLPLERGLIIVYLGASVVGGALLAFLFGIFKGGPHILAMFYAMAPAAIYFLIGRVYDLPRYQWVAVIGLVASVALEAFATTAAAQTSIPYDFWHVSPFFGNPTIPCFVFAVLMVVSGIMGLVGGRRARHDG